MFGIRGVYLFVCFTIFGYKGKRLWLLGRSGYLDFFCKSCTDLVRKIFRFSFEETSCWISLKLFFYILYSPVVGIFQLIFYSFCWLLFIPSSLFLSRRWRWTIKFINTRTKSLTKQAMQRSLPNTGFSGKFLDFIIIMLGLWYLLS